MEDHSAWEAADGAGEGRFVEGDEGAGFEDGAVVAGYDVAGAFEEAVGI